ncbi:MAG: hypothetical protein ACYDIC_19215 [Desulfobaccales bacterium]
MMNLEGVPASMERPREVVYAVRLAYASLVLTLVAFPLRRPEFIKSHLPVLGIFALFVALSVSCIIILMILRGQNWARLLFITLFFLGLPFSVPGFLMTLAKNPAAALIMLLQLALQMMAAVLLLQRPVRDWFRFIKLRRLMNYQVT